MNFKHIAVYLSASLVTYTSLSFADSKYSIPKPTFIAAPKKQDAQSLSEYHNRLLIHPFVTDLRKTLDIQTASNFNSCIKTSSVFMPNLPLEAVSSLCYTTGKDRVDSGVDYMFTGKELIVSGRNKIPLPDAKKTPPNPHEDAAKYYFPNTCSDADPEKRGLVRYQVSINFSEDLRAEAQEVSDISQLNGMFLKNIFTTDKIAQLETDMKKLKIDSSKAFVFLHPNGQGPLSICIECPPDSISNGYTCIKGECSIFDEECTKPRTCSQEQVKIGNTCTASCHEDCKGKINYLRTKYSDILYSQNLKQEFFISKLIGISKANALMVGKPDTDGLTEHELQKLREVRQRHVKRLESNLLNALKQCDLKPDQKLCEEFSSFIREDDFVYSFKQCKERGGLLGPDNVCEPEVCQSCPSYYYYEGPTILAGCNYDESSKAIKLTSDKKNHNKNPCKNGKCAREPFYESEVRKTLETMGIRCVRSNPALSAGPSLEKRQQTPATHPEKGVR